MKKTNEKLSGTRISVFKIGKFFRLFNISIVIISLFLSLPYLGIAQESNWSVVSLLPENRGELSTSVVNGKIFLFGGYTTSGSHKDVTSLVLAYDPVLDDWDTCANMVPGTAGLSTSAVGSKIYAFGGRAPWPDYKVPLPTVQVYDVANNVWDSCADLPTPRIFTTACTVEGKIYVIGGTPGEVNNSWEALKTVEMYDPQTNSWTTKADMPTGRWGAKASVINRKIYVVGGASTFPPGTGLKNVEEYDPESDTWNKRKDMPTARVWSACAEVYGNIFAIGGNTTGEGTVLLNVERYNPITDTWHHRIQDNLPGVRMDHSVNSVDRRIYVFGGVGQDPEHVFIPEVLVFDAPLFYVKSKSVLATTDSLVVEIHEDCQIFIVPEGTPAILDSITNNYFASFNATANHEQSMPLNGIPLGTCLTFGVTVDGRVVPDSFPFWLVDTVPEFYIEVRDSATNEILPMSSVFINGKLSEDRDGKIDLTGWIYDTCTVKAVKHGYTDFDTTLVVRSNTTLKIYLVDTIPPLPPPVLTVSSQPVQPLSGRLEMKLSEDGSIYMVPQGTPAVKDSIEKYAVRTYTASADELISIKVFWFPLGKYQLYGISRAGKIAGDSYILEIISHYPKCNLQVLDAESKEIIDSCLLVVKCPMMFEGQDTTMGPQGEFDLTGLVFDTCSIKVTKEGYVDFETTLVVLRDTSYVINIPKIIDGVPESVNVQIIIYPNPASDLITVQVRDQKVRSLEIITMDGRVLRTLEFSETIIVDLSKFPGGVYLFRIMLRDTISTVRIIKY